MSDITIEKLEEVFRAMLAKTPERKCFVLKPALEGYAMYEVSEETANQMLTLEALKLQQKKKDEKKSN